MIATLLLSLAVTTALPEPRQVAFLPLVSVSVDEAERTAVEEALRRRAPRFGAAPLGQAETREFLQDIDVDETAVG